jgi:hypothetical protein
MAKWEYIGGIARFDETESGADTSIYFQDFMQKGQPQHDVVSLHFSVIP